MFISRRNRFQKFNGAIARGGQGCLYLGAFVLAFSRTYGVRTGTGVEHFHMTRVAYGSHSLPSLNSDLRFFIPSLAREIPV